MREIGDYLGNTPAVAERSYVDPRVPERYERAVKPVAVPVLDAPAVTTVIAGRRAAGRAPSPR